RHDRRGERYPILRITVRDLRDGCGRGMDSVAIAPVHRVGTRGEWLSLAPTIRSVAGGFAVDDVRSDCQDRLGMPCIAVGRVLAQLFHEGGDKPRGKVIDAIVVVSK